MKTKKQNDYQKFFAIKRALKGDKAEDLFYNDKRITDVYLESIHVLAGISYLEVRLENVEDTIYADIQGIKIVGNL